MTILGGSYLAIIKFLRERKGRHWLGAVIFLITAFFGASQSLAYWSNPNEPAPDSTIAYPLITGQDQPTLRQIKAGPLNVTGILDVYGQTKVNEIAASGKVTVDGELCLNNNCINRWSELGVGYVHLRSNTATDIDIGNFGLQGVSSSSTDLSLTSRILPLANVYGVQATAGQPTTTTETAGIVGQSYNNEQATAKSYGIAGVAANISYCVGGNKNGQVCSDDAFCGSPAGHCAGVTNSAGVWGSSGGLANAWAGRFDARVGVEGDLCINNSCRNKQNIGDVSSSNDYVRVQQDASPDFQDGLVQVDGSFQGGDIVLGQPTTTTSILVTCGDGVCDYGGNGEDSSTCPADCQ